MLGLILKFVLGIIFFDKEKGLNIFLLTDDEMMDHNLKHKKKDHTENDPFPIYLGDKKI